MLLQGVSLQNFRSIATDTIFFDEHVSYIVGQNTAGKTNILEAIGLVSTGKSFRGVMDREMIAWNETISRVKAKVDEEELEIMLTQGVVNQVKTPLKKFMINGVARRSLDYIGRLKTIIFSPEDLDLVIGSPSIRRQFLDNLLSQANKEYRNSLTLYERAIRQRNKLLYLIHEGLSDRHQLGYWDSLVIQHGQMLNRLRSYFLDFCASITIPTKAFVVWYDQSTISEERLAKYAQEEIAAKVTLVGPHRDDFKIKLKQINPSVQPEYIDVSVYGSRGEQRLSVLWLKLAALAFLVETTGDKPLLLLDDIFSELDVQHQRIVMDVVKNYQTIITSADPQAVAAMKKIIPGVLIAL